MLASKHASSHSATPSLVALRAWQAPPCRFNQQQTGLVPFQLELGLDLGLKEATAAQVAALPARCGGIRPRGDQRGLCLLADGGQYWAWRCHVVAPWWLMVEFGQT